MLIMEVKISIGYDKKNVLYNDINLSFEFGEINHIIGENGTGKSTIYKTLIGELKPLSGEIPIEIKNNIAIISDYISVPIEVKVIDLLNFIKTADMGYMQANFKKITELVLSLKNKKITELSTGQKRIVEIFIALSARKQILILDEACSGLDYKNRDFFLKNILELVEQKKYTSHNVEDVMKLPGNVYVLDKEHKKMHKYISPVSMDELSAILKH